VAGVVRNIEGQRERLLGEVEQVGMILHCGGNHTADCGMISRSARNQWCQSEGCAVW